jgi:hypothetical protein
MMKLLLIALLGALASGAASDESEDCEHWSQIGEWKKVHKNKKLTKIPPHFPIWRFPGSCSFTLFLSLLES